MSGRSAVTVIAAAALLVSCAAPARQSGNEGGGPLPQQLPGEFYPGPRVELSGTMVVAENGCVFLDRAGELLVAIWPAGSRQIAAEVELPDRSRVASGQVVEAVGTLLPVGQLAGFPDGYWGNTLVFCDPAATRVAVFDEVVSDGR